MRRERGHLLGGVTTGMAAAFDVDVMVVRVIWVIATIVTGGLGVVAYGICWIAFPSDERPAPINQVHQFHEIRRRGAGYVIGAVLLGIGLLIGLGQIVALRPFRHFGALVWATLLIGGGLAVLLLRHPDDYDLQDPPPAAWIPPPRAPEAPLSAPDATPSAPEATSAPESGTGTPPVPNAGAPGDWASVYPTAPTAPTAAMDPSAPPAPPSDTTTAWTQFAPWPEPPRRPPRPPRPRAFLTPLTISLLLIGGGVVTLLDNNGTAHLTVAEILAGGLCIVGLALMLSTWLGRARGLVPIGLLLLLVTLPAATIDVPITGGTGNHEYHPATRSELQSKYEMGIGRLNLDLVGVPLAGHTTHIHAQLGIGALQVDVPSSVRVVVHAHAGAGSLRLFGANDGGWPDNRTRTAPGSRAGELDLDLRVGAGEVQVRRFDSNGDETLIPEARL